MANKADTENEARMTSEEWSMLKSIINNHDDRLRTLEGWAHRSRVAQEVVE